MNKKNIKIMIKIILMDKKIIIIIKMNINISLIFIIQKKYIIVRNKNLMVVPRIRKL
jgi:hypothetical protein